MARKRDHFSRQTHERLASHVVKILQEIDSLGKVLQELPPTGPSSTRAKTTDLYLLLGNAANGLQMHLEGRMSADENSDLRSWPLYYPRDIEAAHVGYGRPARRPK
jgi:hypothetical protein